MKRSAQVHRKTRETDISVFVNLDGEGKNEIQTPVGFLTHMLETFSRYAMLDLNLKAAGDVYVDQHHLLEDCGLLLGKALSDALGNRSGILRAGYFVYPMDEALAVVAVDIGGRPHLQFDAAFKRRHCGDLDTDLLADFFQALTSALGANIVIRMPYGRSDHHKIEAVFKAFGRSLRAAVARDPRAAGQIPSTKGVVDYDRNS
jgi:imidazoleglycerol-phosphate dehydratase